MWLCNLIIREKMCCQRKGWNNYNFDNNTLSKNTVKKTLRLIIILGCMYLRLLWIKRLYKTIERFSFWGYHIYTSYLSMNREPKMLSLDVRIKSILYNVDNNNLCKNTVNKTLWLIIIFGCMYLKLLWRKRLYKMVKRSSVWGW